MKAFFAHFYIQNYFFLSENKKRNNKMRNLNENIIVMKKPTKIQIIIFKLIIMKKIQIIRKIKIDFNKACKIYKKSKI